VQELVEMNVEMGRKESARDVPYFKRILAPAFAMHRANPDRTLVDREGFLSALPTGNQAARETVVESVAFFGAERAVVTCVVAMEKKRYHNLRVFVKNRTDTEPKWLLLAWVNEPAAY